MGSLCEVLDSKRKPITKRNRTEGTFPYYGATGIVDYVADYIFDEKLVLIGEDGAKWDSGDKTAFIVEGKCWVNNHAHVIKPHRDKLLDEWLVYYFFHKDLNEFVTGLTVPKLNQGQLRSIPIPLPPLETQRKIVSKLDAIFLEIDKAKSATEENNKNAEALLQSYLTEVFYNGGDNWLSENIGNLCTELFAGGDVPKDRMSKTETTQFFIPIYTNGEKSKGLYGYTDKPRVRSPSITISARGTIGYSEVRYEPFYPAIRLIVATPNTEIIQLDYLKYAIKSLKFIHSGASIPQLTVPMIKNYLIKLPKSKDEQIKIIDKLDALSLEISNLLNSTSLKLIQLSKLRQSILKKAFNGELVKE